MQNPRISARYAKSLVDLSLQLDQLESVFRDMVLLEGICGMNPDFVQMLRSPVIREDKKRKVLKAILEERVSPLTEKFALLLVSKGREGLMPEIAHSFLSQYRKIHQITRVRLTTAIEVDEALRESLSEKIRQESAFPKIQLEVCVDPSLIGGFVLEMEDILLDASIRRELKDIRKQFLENIYVPNIR